MMMKYKVSHLLRRQYYHFFKCHPSSIKVKLPLGLKEFVSELETLVGIYI